MEKIQITIDPTKVTKEKITTREYEDKLGTMVKKTELKMVVVPLKESKVIWKTMNENLSRNTSLQKSKRKRNVNQAQKQTSLVKVLFGKTRGSQVLMHLTTMKFLLAHHSNV